MGIVNMLLPAAWYEGKSGEWIEAIVFVTEDGGCREVVIEPREHGDVEGFRLDEGEWEEIKEFVATQFRRLDEAEKERNSGHSGNE